MLEVAHPQTNGRRSNERASKGPVDDHKPSQAREYYYFLARKLKQLVGRIDMVGRVALVFVRESSSILWPGTVFGRQWGLWKLQVGRENIEKDAS